MEKPDQVTDNPGFAPRCLSLDLEVGKTDSRIHQFAAVRGDTQEAFVFNKGPLAEAVALERALVDALRLSAPDLAKGESSVLHLRQATQHLKDQGHAHALPQRVMQLLKGLANDGRGEDSGVGSVRLRRLDDETVQVSLQREWSALEKTARLRRAAAELLLTHLLACLPQGQRGTDLLAETTLGRLLAALQADLVLRAEVKEPTKLLDRALLWMHEQEVIRLNKGLAIFRPAMTIRLAREKRGFVKADFAPLQLHYAEQVIQIHVMAEYVQRGLKAMAEALRLAMDYFSLSQETFISRWLPGRDKELGRQTTPRSWRDIVESLSNPIQQRIVADDREQTNVLVLAGPGSGKTRVLVHRIAYLVRVRRENPRGILALAYNRHAAVEIRRRLTDLIGHDARGVTVLTCHAFAMRLVGASFADRANRVNGDTFKEIMREAIDLLRGSGQPVEEADETRDRLLAGFRWILVDEYQDVGPEQYELIAALAGRTLADDEGRLTLFAVGDDDQNIYAFDGASVEYIRRFEADYAARVAYLTENYRSTIHIIDAANAVIGTAGQRMKRDRPITIDSRRGKSSPGGVWQTIDPVGRGRVQILPAGRNGSTQAMAVMAELERMARLDPDWDWARVAVIAREWKYLEPLRGYCEMRGIPARMAKEESVPFWRLRETQALVDWLRADRQTGLVDHALIQRWLNRQADGPWWSLLREALEEYGLETRGVELPTTHFIDWLAEWGREVRRRQTGLLLLTAHRAKGLEFDHVVVLDGAWDKVGRGDDPDAPRRLLYVAMTRARQTLSLARLDAPNPLLAGLSEAACLLERATAILDAPPAALAHRYHLCALADVDLGYAGRYPDGSVVHGAIASLKPGDALGLREREGRLELVDASGITVGRLSRGFAIPPGRVFHSASVAAVIVRDRDDAEAAYRPHCRCESWELVVPELVFSDTP